MKGADLTKYLLPLSLALCALALSPSKAHASRVCAPDNRGCFGTTEKCSKIELLPGWTCARIIVTPPSDYLVREANGRAAAVVDGKKIYFLSDALETQFARKKPTAEEFAKLVFADHGSVGGESLLRLSKELGLRIAK